jgi:hypothetical protein
VGCNDLCTKEATGQCALCDVLAERDRFIRLWLKGGIFIDLWRRWWASRESEQDGNRSANSIPYYSRHREEITIKELHDLLIHRIYHEDNLLQMRNYNFITANVFLGAGFVIVTMDSAKELSKFGYAIAGLGFFWALLQVVYGKMQVSATNLWRKQAWMAEDALNMKFDSTLFELYKRGQTTTRFGPITR